MACSKGELYIYVVCVCARARVRARVRGCVRVCVLFVWYNYHRRFQWPRGLLRRSAAARLLGLWVRIPPGHECLSVVRVVCCQVEISATSWSFVQSSPTDYGAPLHVIYEPR